MKHRADSASTTFLSKSVDEPLDNCLIIEYETMTEEEHFLSRKKARILQ